MRYRIDTDCIIDQKTGEILTTRKTVNRLNKQETLLQIERKEMNALRTALNNEIENADGELKKALIRISNKELIY